MTTSGIAGWRRQLSRDLSDCSRRTLEEMLQEEPASDQPGPYRLGITGPPGAGKSSLIAQLSRRHIDAGEKVGVLAIDPTSPLSRGSLLGDRIRMDDVADEDAFFIRSLPSGSRVDGLCPKLGALLRTMETADFSEIIVETVGVGQVAHNIASLVDTLMVVLVPESGDTIQAMKAGILELAHIYVVNKADRPGAMRLRGELSAILAHRQDRGHWRPPVLLVSTTEEQGLDELDAAIRAHRATCGGDSVRRDTARLLGEARALLEQRLDDAEAELGAAAFADLAEAYRALRDRFRVD